MHDDMKFMACNKAVVAPYSVHGSTKIFVFHYSRLVGSVLLAKRDHKVVGSYCSCLEESMPTCFTSRAENYMAVLFHGTR